jgi:hypothetical protein
LAASESGKETIADAIAIADKKARLCFAFTEKSSLGS